MSSGEGATVQVEAEAGAPPQATHTSQWRETWDALVTNKLAVFGLIVIAALVVTAVLGELLAPYGVNEVMLDRRLEAPSLSHPLGTDQLGRDILSRVMVGARVSLIVGAVAVGISLLAGTAFGVIAGFYGGRLDDLIMRFQDVLFAFPALLMAIAVLAILGPGIVNAMIAIGIVYTPIFARVARGAVLSAREEVYVKAARSLGATDLRLMWRHILPNIAAPLIVQTSISFAFAILSEAALSFLGLSVQPPDPSWGVMLFEGRGFMEEAWWIATFPGLAIFLVVLAFNVIGDALRDALDPRQRSEIQSSGVGA
jgi:peptide/nickel transport system permease protein